MAEAAEKVSAGWVDGAVVDLDAECRTLTLQALGRSVLGLDLTDHVDDIAEPLRTALTYVADRSLRPVRAPRWLPTPERRRAYAASAALHRLAGDILAKCRADPSTDAPLVQALIAATDPVTGNGLSDSEIADELIVFLFAGHDTTATTLTYAMWELGRHPDIQDRVAAEVAELPDRELEPDDVVSPGLHGAGAEGGAAPVPTGADRDPDGHPRRRSRRVPGACGHAADLRHGWQCSATPRSGTARWSSTPTGSARQNMKSRDRWQYIPFGGGPRACIGDHFAMLEATLGLATFIRRAEVRSLNADFPLAVPFTMVADGPIRARIQQSAQGDCAT